MAPVLGRGLIDQRPFCDKSPRLAPRPLRLTMRAMQACSYVNLAAAAVAAVLVSFAGCASSVGPAPTSPEASEPAEPAALAEESAASENSGEASGEDSLMGEDDPANAPATGNEVTTGGEGGETRTTAVIQQIVKDNRKAVRACYDKARKDLPTLQGDMTIFFVLDADGKVKQAELNQERSTLKSPEVVSCAIDVIKSLKFPPSSRGMESKVNYPFNFRPDRQ
jgi:hypothetical protein